MIEVRKKLDIGYMNQAFNKSDFEVNGKFEKIFDEKISRNKIGINTNQKKEIKLNEKFDVDDIYNQMEGLNSNLAVKNKKVLEQVTSKVDQLNKKNVDEIELDELKELEENQKEAISLLEVLKVDLEEIFNVNRLEANGEEIITDDIDGEIAQLKFDVENSNDNNFDSGIKSEFDDVLKLISEITEGNLELDKKNIIISTDVIESEKKLIENMKSLISKLNKVSKIPKDLNNEGNVEINVDIKKNNRILELLSADLNKIEQKICKIEDLFGLMNSDKKIEGFNEGQINRKDLSDLTNLNLEDSDDTLASKTLEINTNLEEESSESKSEMNDSNNPIVGSKVSSTNSATNIEVSNFDKILDQENVSKDITQQVYKQINRVKLKAGEQTIKMILKPEALGEVSLKMSFDKGVLTTQLIADSDLVKEALEKNLVQLKEQLENQGYEIKEFRVLTKEEAQQSYLNQYDEEKNNSNNSRDEAKKHNNSKNDEFSEILDEIDEIA